MPLSQAHSAVNIIEVSTSTQSYLNVEDDRLTQRSVSVETFGETSSPEGSITSDNSEGVKKKKSSKIERFKKTFTHFGKKYRNKQKVMEEMNGS